jgi:4-hydroxy-2-oxoheptanedioate aldolase
MSVSPSALHNPFKAALRKGRRQIGLWQALANPYTIEICAGAGFDWLLLDGEHAPNDIPTLLAQLQAAAPYPVHAVGRPPVGDPHVIKQYLDIGFQTLLIPFVETAGQAEALVRAVRYPPFGIRGVAPGLSRAARWGRVADYLDRADDEICLLVQIESVTGIENLDSICAVDGVDGLFIGPADLSAAFGHRGRPGDPAMVERIEDAIRRIVASGKAAGILALDPAFAERCGGLGCTFIAVGTDTGLLARASSELAGDARRAPSSSDGIGY